MNAVIRKLVEAARRHELGAMHALIDWELGGMATLAKSLTGLDPAWRAPASRRGLQEIDRSSFDPARVQMILEELALDLSDPHLPVRRAEGAEAEQAIADAQIAATPEETAPEVASRLDDARARAAGLHEAWILGRSPPGREYRLLITPEGDRAVIAR